MRETSALLGFRPLRETGFRKRVVSVNERQHYNTVRPYSLLAYKPPAPEATVWPRQNGPASTPAVLARPSIFMNWGHASELRDRGHPFQGGSSLKSAPSGSSCPPSTTMVVPVT